jgi:hypothetical protein
VRDIPDLRRGALLSQITVNLLLFRPVFPGITDTEYTELIYELEGFVE